MRPSAEEIRTLDGRRLTELAYRLGLAPDNVMTVWDDGTGAFRGCWYANQHGDPLTPWDPATDLAQADAVFRHLRARHLSCATEYWGTTGNGKLMVYANHRGTRLLAAQVWGPGVLESSEALALVRCACLAVVSEEEDAHGV